MEQQPPVLEVRRATLEDTYMAMVQRYESGPARAGAAAAPVGARGATFGGAA